MAEDNVRHPRALVYANGILIPWLEVEVNSNNYYQADSFRVTTIADFQGEHYISRSWWRSQNPICVEIYMGDVADPNNYSKKDLKLMIVGDVDELPHDMVPNTITLYGRDYSSYMIDTKIVVDDHLSRTASDIAIMYAKKYGLSTTNITKTTDTIGTIYKHAFTKLNRGTTEWNFLCFLAQEELFNVFIDGRDLHFEPVAENPPVYPIEWIDADENGNKKFKGTKLSCVRNLTLAKDIIVHLRVKNIKTGKPFSVKYEAPHTKDKTLNRGGRYIGTPQAVFRYENVAMDKKQAYKRAMAIIQEISRHQVKLVADGIPADVKLTPRHIVRLSGTNDYDQDYHPDQIIRNITMAHGWTMNITAKNHDVNTVMPV